MACCNPSKFLSRNAASRKKNVSYDKNKIHSDEEDPYKVSQFKEIQKKIRALPEEIRLYIVSYLARPQPPSLLKDIRNFYQSYCFLLSVICRNDKSILVDRILTFYDMIVFYKNIHPNVKRNIKRWQIRKRNIEVIDEFTIVEYPNILPIIGKSNKWILLWGTLPQYHRNKYLNFLYSIIESESDEEEPIDISIVLPISIYIDIPTNMTIV